MRNEFGIFGGPDKGTGSVFGGPDKGTNPHIMEIVYPEPVPLAYGSESAVL